jgi:hypothetical protein
VHQKIILKNDCNLKAVRLRFLHNAMGAKMIGNKYDRPKSGVRVSMAQETFEEIKHKTAKQSFEAGQASLIRILSGFNAGEIPRDKIEIIFKDAKTTDMMIDLINRLEPTPRNEYVR